MERMEKLERIASRLAALGSALNRAVTRTEISAADMEALSHGEWYVIQTQPIETRRIEYIGRLEGIDYRNNNLTLGEVDLEETRLIPAMWNSDIRRWTSKTERAIIPLKEIISVSDANGLPIWNGWGYDICKTESS
jgi:hypothetical protein